MIYLLRAKEMTVSQIAEQLRLTPQAIYHQVRKLKDAGLVEVAKEERVDHFIETYYRASAEVFHMAHGVGESKEYIESQVKEALGGLQKLGIQLEDDPAAVDKLAKLAQAMKDPMGKTQWNDKAAALDDVDFFARQAILEYINLIMMSEKDCDEFCNLYREYRKALKALVKDPNALARKAA